MPGKWRSSMRERCVCAAHVGVSACGLRCQCAATAVSVQPPLSVRPPLSVCSHRCQRAATAISAATAVSVQPCQCGANAQCINRTRVKEFYNRTGHAVRERCAIETVLSAMRLQTRAAAD